MPIPPPNQRNEGRKGEGMTACGAQRWTNDGVVLPHGLKGFMNDPIRASPRLHKGGRTKKEQSNVGII